MSLARGRVVLGELHAWIRGCFATRSRCSTSTSLRGRRRHSLLRSTAPSTERFLFGYQSAWASDPAELRSAVIVRRHLHPLSLFVMLRLLLLLLLVLMVLVVLVVLVMLLVVLLVVLLGDVCRRDTPASSISWRWLFDGLPFHCEAQQLRLLLREMGWEKLEGR